MLACSFDEVLRRLDRRGTHRVSYLLEIGAPLIAEAYLDARYRETTRIDYFSRTKSAFTDDLYDVKVPWAPDGDAAFDDGSYILQFDVREKVRLIAFQNLECPVETANSVEEIWLESDIFYGVLAEWSERFAADWADRLGDENPEAGPL